jgi:ribosomal protein S18 acetylase RimI-like enzyme
MTLTIVEDSPGYLADYGRVSIGFSVAAAFDAPALAALARGTPAVATALARPYWKDYDEHPGSCPTEWAARFDLSRWSILAAYRGDQRVGGAAVVSDDPLIDLLRECAGCALLWDLRVDPEHRAHGIGSALLRAVEETALQRGARVLRVETQQINVPACRFYQRHGFHLERITPGAYANLPDETQLIWRKALP